MNKTAIVNSIKNTPKLKLNKRNLASWVKALRSGKFQQGLYQLRTHDNKYCCLGVAATVCPNTLGKGASVDAGYDLNESYFPSAIAGFLSNANDTKRWTFEEIASWLEEKVMPHLPAR